MLSFATLLLLTQTVTTSLSTKRIIQQEIPAICSDHVRYCQFVKNFCDSPKHGAIMKRDCALTCKLCDSSTIEVDTWKRAGIYPDNQVSRSPDEFPVDGTSSTTADSIHYEVDKGTKCKFPGRTTLPASSISMHNNKENEGNHSQTFNNSSTTKISLNGTAHGKPTNVLGVMKSPRSPRKNSSTKSSSNRELIEYLKNRKKLTTPTTRTVENTTTITIKNASVLSSVEPYEVRKAKLEEMMKSKTTTGNESAIFPYERVLIKGDCFDEYIYCREFSSFCTDSKFDDVMAKYCALTCKTCGDIEQEEDEVKCFDITSACTRHRNLCYHTKYKPLMTDNCSKACKFCQPSCKDRHQSCPQFVKNGFCDDQMYTSGERKHLCSESCKYC